VARLVAAVLPALTCIGDQPKPALGADELYAVLETADLWRRPERFALLLNVLACTLAPADQPVVQTLKRAANSASGVEPKALMAQGFTGRALGEAIRQERLQRIQQAITP